MRLSPILSGGPILTHSLVRKAALGALLAATSVFTACSGGNSLATPISAAQPQINTLTYTAVGASDAAGYGASVTCNTAQNPVIVALPACPGGTGYVPVIAAQLAASGTSVTLNDLGISGAVIGPDIATLQATYGTNCASSAAPQDFITNEVPALKGDEKLVTIFAGANDTNAIVNAAVCQELSGKLTSATIPAFLTQEITAFGEDFLTLTTAIHQKAPNARIVVANIPNFANLPFASEAQYAPAKSLLQTVSVGIDTNVYAAAATSSSLPVVDLLCNAQSYAAANFSSDGFHPDDAGYALIAQAFLAQINASTATPPAASCAYMNVLSTSSASASRALRTLPAFDKTII